MKCLKMLSLLPPPFDSLIEVLVQQKTYKYIIIQGIIMAKNYNCESPLGIRLCIPHDANSALSTTPRYFSAELTQRHLIFKFPLFFLVYYLNTFLYKFLLIHNCRSALNDTL